MTTRLDRFQRRHPGAEFPVALLHLDRFNPGGCTARSARSRLSSTTSTASPRRAGSRRRPEVRASPVVLALGRRPGRSPLGIVGTALTAVVTFSLAAAEGRDRRALTDPVLVSEVG